MQHTNKYCAVQQLAMVPLRLYIYNTLFLKVQRSSVSKVIRVCECVYMCMDV